MIGRIATWIFYAVFFFLVGVWAGPRLPSLDGMVASVVDLGYRGIARVQEWAISDNPEKPAEKAPAAAAVPAAGELAAARDAYARGDVAGAIAAYEEFLRQSPDDVDARGELGNVLYSAGRFPEAARVFHETALALLKRGDAAKARALEPAIRRGDAMLADDLLKRLAEPSSASGENLHMPAGQSAVTVAVR